jgi:hypothetical protein
LSLSGAYNDIIYMIEYVEIRYKVEIYIISNILHSRVCLTVLDIR